MKNVFSISLGDGYIPLILVCYHIHYNNHVQLSIHFEEWSLTDEVVHEISLISKTS
jgi:hypothetical protein